MYINDLPDKLCSSRLMFADDTKVFREICSETDFEFLQRYLAAKIPPGKYTDGGEAR